MCNLGDSSTSLERNDGGAWHNRAGAADRQLWRKLHSADISPWASTCSSAPSRRGLQECGLLASLYHHSVYALSQQLGIFSGTGRAEVGRLEGMFGGLKRYSGQEADPTSPSEERESVAREESLVLTPGLRL